MLATTIRPMTEADCPAVSRVVCDAFAAAAARSGFSDEQVRRYVEQRGSAERIGEQFREYDGLVACVGGEVVGVIATQGDEIAKLFVAPAQQRRGIGRRLFDAAERAIAGAGHGELRLGCLFPASVPFYQAMGMTVTGRRHVTTGPMAGEDVTLLSKRLALPGPA